MKSPKKKRLADELLEGMQDFAEALETSDQVSEQYTARTMKLNLKPAFYTAEEVREIRDMLRVSQPIFAEFLGVSVKTVQAWEQGKNPPVGAAARLMTMIRQNPKLYREELKKLATA
jgi:putative transcriptional regulator